MSSLIEQAAKRLEQLRRAGIDILDDRSEPTGAIGPVIEGVKLSERSGNARGDAGDLGIGDHGRTIAALPRRDVMTSSQQVELDLGAIAAKGVITPSSARTRAYDEFRIIKRPLISNIIGKGALRGTNRNLIMVTSALPGEGKTFTAINLAMSIAAELDNTVMLVDADVAAPSVLRILGVPAGPGLLDVLKDPTIDLSQVLLKTNVGKLTLLPSGSRDSHATELLASDAMVNLLSDISTRYPDRIVVFDSPPLLLTTEAHVLASQMGQIVVVVQAEQTSHSDVKQALATIEDCPVKLMVLNQTRARHRDEYGYGYGYDEHSEEQAA